MPPDMLVTYVNTSTAWMCCARSMHLRNQALRGVCVGVIF